MLKAPTKERQRQITVIFDPEKTEKQTFPTIIPHKRRVAAYARVSTDFEEQESSLEAQVKYYTEYVKNKPDLELVGIYADDGISGTSFKKRDEFNRMIEDALNGKIDLILTKSISRFSRNTVDSLSITRQLKAKGVEVYFEKENISSMDAQAELLFTIMSSIAQEESRSISENVRWGKQRSMESGKVSVAWSSFLGYTKGPDGLPMIVEEEAEIVRQIYAAYIDGKSFKQIAEDLTAQSYKTPKGKDIWSRETVRSILTNEKYKGDARLQKTYTVDFLTKEVRVNHGERKQWYIKDSHDAIVSPETFELVQKEIERRCARGGKFYDSPFTGKIICGDCGAYYGHCIWHSNSKYAKNIWLCNKKHTRKAKCASPKIEDKDIEAAFALVTSRLLVQRNNYVEEYEESFIPMLGDISELEKKLQTLSNEFSELVKQAESLIDENAKKAQEQAGFTKHFNELEEQMKQKKVAMEATEKEISDTLQRKENTRVFLEGLKSLELNTGRFDTAAWHRLVDYTKVMPDKTIIFRLRDGHDETVRSEEVH